MAAKKRDSTALTAVAPEPKRFFLERYALDEGVLADTITTAIARKADFADLYFEFRTVQGVSLEEGSVKKTTHSVSQGVGVRVLAGDKTGYAYSDEVTVERDVADRARRSVERMIAIGSPSPTAE